MCVIFGSPERRKEGYSPSHNTHSTGFSFAIFWKEQRPGSFSLSRPTSANRIESATKMLKSHILSLSIVMLYILFSTFIFLFIVKTEMVDPGTFSFLLKLRTKLRSCSDTTSEFQREADVKNSTESKPCKVQPPTHPASPRGILPPTRHPLEVPYPRNYQFLLNEPNKCLERTPFLVLLVVTESKRFSQRYAVRQSWGNDSLIPGVSILHLFLIGVHPLLGAIGLQKLLIKESAQYRDIIQQDFLDTYNNLTLKTLMGMEWISKFCPNATYVMKADCDVFLNVDYLVSQLLQPHLPPKKDYITGFIWRDKPPMRGMEMKWFTPWEVYPNDTYPHYPAGPGYVLSGDLASRIYQVAQTIKVINMEDAFIGICLHWLGINVTDSPLGIFNVFKIEYEKCRFSKLVFVHDYGPGELLKIWADFRRESKTC